MAKNNAWVFDVTEAEFEERWSRNRKRRPWSSISGRRGAPRANRSAPILEAKVAEREGAVLLAKVNTDEEQNLAAQFGISGIPHVVAFRKGKPFLQFTGLAGRAQLVDFFAQLQPTEAEKTLRRRRSRKNAAGGGGEFIPASP